MAEPSSAGPSLAVQQAARSPGPVPGEWQIEWQLENRGDLPLEIRESWLPHGRFRGEPRPALPPVTLPSGARTLLPTTVRWNEVPGTEVENAFLILRARWQGEVWRVLARLRVTAGAGGAPESQTEVVTVQPVGFARSG